MASYVVFEEHGSAPDESAVYVRDGFHWLAFLFAPVWLLWHRLWIEALVAIALTVGVGALAGWAGTVETGSLVSLLVSLGIGLEAPALRMWALRRRGWRQWGVVEASNEDEAEIRHLAEAIDDFNTEPPRPDPMQFGAPRPISGPALGLFAWPGSR